MKVGDSVWFFDRRVYRPGRGSPDWRACWTAVRITGETSRSWIAGEAWNQTKLPKRAPWPQNWAMTEAEVDRRSWVRGNARRLGEAVGRSESYDLLKQIEALLS